MQLVSVLKNVLTSTRSSYRLLSPAVRLMASARRISVVHIPDTDSEYPHLEYAILDRKTPHRYVDLYHTWTPVHLRGQGLAAHLADAAFSHFKGWRIRVSCTYLQAYARKRPHLDYVPV
ncbi:unnamed protein product [Cyprideis torosa]|uniref:Protein NATD1 n=1 Tax=Cyprideis torosa TaxID=163714 RepID=A0A7R8WME6_9CRUS|nr:unnamed protein product [Cyprideis torosa]CAG0899230.1 unnamed protein product [Cyprideis torosa]